MKTKEIITLLAADVYANEKFDGGKFVMLNVLVYPELTNSDINSINPKDYVWEERVFEYPLFKNRKVGNMFALEIKVTDNSSSISGIDDEILNKKIKKLFDINKKYMDKSFAKLAKSKIFKPLDKPIKL